RLAGWTHRRGQERAEVLEVRRGGGGALERAGPKPFAHALVGGGGEQRLRDVLLVRVAGVSEDVLRRGAESLHGPTAAGARLLELRGAGAPRLHAAELVA